MLVVSLVLLAASLPFRSREVTLGVALGAALAAMNWLWLKRFFGRLVEARRSRAAPPAALLYATKYLVTGATVFAALRWRLVNVFGLLAGLLVVILAVTLEGIATTSGLRKEGKDAP
jgi:hypothetical protein